MILILAVLALPIGFLVRNRLAAYLIYAIGFAHLYTYQTALLVMEWTNGSTTAFSRDDSTQLLDGTISYFLFTTVIYAAGFGLVTLGRWLRDRRAPARDEVRLDAEQLA
jgi:hypothetical protein